MAAPYRLLLSWARICMLAGLPYRLLLFSATPAGVPHQPPPPPPPPLSFPSARWPSPSPLPRPDLNRFVRSQLALHPTTTFSPTPCRNHLFPLRSGRCRAGNDLRVNVSTEKDTGPGAEVLVAFWMRADPRLRMGVWVGVGVTRPRLTDYYLVDVTDRGPAPAFSVCL